MSEKYCDLAIPPRGVPTRAEFEEVKERIDNIINAVYPVGSYYWSDRETSPADLWHVGTWERVKDRFVLAAGDSYAAGSTGGEAAHTLNVNEMPSHSHSISINAAGNHQHQPNGWTWVVSKDFSSGKYTVYSNSSGNADPRTDASAKQDYASEYAGNHTHGASASAAGGNWAHNNMPPYITAYCWHRTA